MAARLNVIGPPRSKKTAEAAETIELIKNIIDL
jgi:hypothetical protein